MVKILIGQQQNVKHNPSLCHKLIWSMKHRSKVFIMDSQITVCSLHSLVTKKRGYFGPLQYKVKQQPEYCQTTSKTSRPEMGASKDCVLDSLQKIIVLLGLIVNYPVSILNVFQTLRLTFHGQSKGGLKRNIRTHVIHRTDLTCNFKE